MIPEDLLDDSIQCVEMLHTHKLTHQMGEEMREEKEKEGGVRKSKPAEVNINNDIQIQKSSLEW